MRNFVLRFGALALLAVVFVFGAGAGAQAKIKVAFVTSESGMGDRSFNDMMDQGMKRAVKELGIDYVIIQPRSISEFQSTLARAAGQGFDIIIGSSFDMIKPMQAAAAAFPQQKFGLVDVGPDPIAPNVVSSVTKDWEGSFLVGVIAAKVTKTGTIGFVGGKDIPIIHRFFVGYYYGAKMAKPEVKVCSKAIPAPSPTRRPARSIRSRSSTRARTSTSRSRAPPAPALSTPPRARTLSLSA